MKLTRLLILNYYCTTKEAPSAKSTLSIVRAHFKLTQTLTRLLQQPQSSTNTNHKGCPRFHKENILSHKEKGRGWLHTQKRRDRHTAVTRFLPTEHGCSLRERRKTGCLTFFSCLPHLTSTNDKGTTYKQPTYSTSKWAKEGAKEPTLIMDHEQIIQ